MSESPEPANSESFDLEWESLHFSSATTASEGWLSADDWEERYTRDTTGYVPDPLTTSFTDLDLSEAQSTLRGTAELEDLDSWSDA